MMKNPILMPIAVTAVVLFIASCASDVPLTASDPLVREHALPQFPVFGSSEFAKGKRAGQADARIKLAPRPGSVAQSLHVKNYDEFRSGYMQGYRKYNPNGLGQGAIPAAMPDHQSTNRRRNF